MQRLQQRRYQSPETSQKQVCQIIDDEFRDLDHWRKHFEETSAMEFDHPSALTVQSTHGPVPSVGTGPCVGGADVIKLLLLGAKQSACRQFHWLDLSVLSYADVIWTLAFAHLPWTFDTQVSYSCYCWLVHFYQYWLHWLMRGFLNKIKFINC